jgi:hypothetical protein
MLRLNTPYLLAPGGAPHATAGAAPDSGGAPRSAGGRTATARGGGGGAAASGSIVITASHFLPHPALPAPHWQPEMRKAVGCAGLLTQIAALGAACHIYGHTHINGAAALPDPPLAAQQAGAAASAGTPAGAQRPFGSGDSSTSAGGTGGGCGGGTGGLGGAPPASRLYVQYALEAVFEGEGARGAPGAGRRWPGLSCVWDGARVGCWLVDIETGARLDWPWTGPGLALD